MENIKNRKYDSNYRRKLLNKINKIKEKKDLINIYNIIHVELDNNISINQNGMFFNLNSVSDEIIDKLIVFLNINIETISVTETEGKIKYQSYITNEIEHVNNIGPKLSNQEKSIIKKFQKN